MAPSTETGRRPPKPVSHSNSHPRPLKRKRGAEELNSLDQRVQALHPKEVEVKFFADLPLSKPTASGLEASHFRSLTDIQQKAVPLALKGSDVLGAARTGSGKTLAFLIPVLENLYRRNWGELDGLGALILSPTRELAIQIFEVLRKIGRYHELSAGLVIGGKSFEDEQKRLGHMNILVSTPGRMLQHMDQTALFDIKTLQMLVLDEADRIMDTDFEGTIGALISHLPRKRQTLLFSATQTKKVADLARLSLRDPEYVAVHEAASSATPSTLQQHYIITHLQHKLDTLWSFIRANLKSKILVFLSSAKQVRFVYESFRHLQPGIPLLHLHGRQKQTARLDITTNFSKTRNSCLFATDVVARGLDFPAVDWVIQLDCPEDADTYIHRVGRTARFERHGRAVLFLEPSEEEGMLARLKHKKVPIERINVRQKKQQSIRNQLQNMCFKDPELKYLGQKAFVSYVRSIHIQRDKGIFKLNELPLEEFSASLGLPGAPKIKFLNGNSAKSLKNAPRATLSSSEEENDETQPRDKPKSKNFARTKYDRMFERRNQDVFADHYTRLVDKNENPRSKSAADADEENDFLTVKRRINHDSSTDDGSDTKPTSKASGKLSTIPGIGKASLVIDSKRKEKLLKSKKRLLKLKEKGVKLIFDDEGNPRKIYELEDENQFKKRGPVDAQKAQFLEKEHESLQAADLVDKETAKEKKRERKEKRRAREAAEAGVDDEKGKAVWIPYDESMGDGETQDEASRNISPEPVAKRPKKWFENDSDAERNSKRRGKSEASKAEPETLEHLEALAAGFLN
ncbi:ATP-dependent RNA helicase dbp4 [Pseudocyphellaria aurata]|nr:ATP-dependent RNA helicase dbp4 [Pseudocyphellaria aurata]